MGPVRGLCRAVAFARHASCAFWERSHHDPSGGEGTARCTGEFADARIEHDVRPTGDTGRALEDATYTLCVMTGTRNAEQALLAADALLHRLSADREGSIQEDTRLAA